MIPLMQDTLVLDVIIQNYSLPILYAQKDYYFLFYDMTGWGKGRLDMALLPYYPELLEN